MNLKELGWNESKTYNKFASSAVVKGYIKGRRALLFYANKKYHLFHVINNTRHTNSIVPDEMREAIKSEMKELGWI